MTTFVAKEGEVNLKKRSAIAIEFSNKEQHHSANDNPIILKFKDKTIEVPILDSINFI